MPRVILNIDSSDLNEKINIMRDALSEEGFNRLMVRTFNEVGKKSRYLIYQGVKPDYVVKRGWVYKSIDSAKISVGDGVNCIIPLNGNRGIIGTDFSAAGGASGRKVRRYRVKSNIVTAGTSTMPKKMSHQGDQPPFRNLAYSKVTFTRKGKARLPIARVAGLALPQMPLNRAENETANQLLEYAMKRLDHNFGYMFKG